MGITDSFLPKELTDVLNSCEFDDEAGILIDSLTYNTEDLVVNFSICFDPYADTPKQLWQINMTNVKNEQIIRNWSREIEILTEHALLLEYNDIHSELYFRGTTDNWQSLFIDIFQSITQLSNEYEDVIGYIFSPERINEFSKQDHGLFARGPVTILKIYEKCLKRAGIKSNFIGNYAPSNGNLMKILKLGDSYFVFDDIRFTRIE